MTLLQIFQELNSFVNCTQHFDRAEASGITTENKRELKELVNGWSNGDYDECPDLFKQRLAALLS
jgi:hypothetical protein